MRLLLLALLLLTSVTGCATTMSPIDMPLDIAVQGDSGDVNTSISNSVENIVSQMEWWQMATVVGLAWLVGWLSPGPLDIIRGFFSGISEVLSGFRLIFGRRG